MLAPAFGASEDRKASDHRTGFATLYASMLILLKRAITEVSRHLGHADVSITMRVYGHFLKTKKQDTMNDLEKLIQNG